MKIAVAGANGRSGKAFVQAALEHRHEIRAGVRGEHSFQAHERLQIVHCDVLDAESVSLLLENCDAVVSMIGHVKGSPPLLQTLATENILAAMKQQNCQHLVSLTGTGVRLAGDKITLIDRLLNAIVLFIDRGRIEDGRQHMTVIQKTSVDWTVVRVLKLTNGKKQSFELKEHGPAMSFVARSTVAAAILEVLETDIAHRQAPIMSRK